MGDVAKWRRLSCFLGLVDYMYMSKNNRKFYQYKKEGFDAKTVGVDVKEK